MIAINSSEHPHLEETGAGSTSFGRDFDHLHRECLPAISYWAGPHACPHCDESHIVQIDSAPGAAKQYAYVCPRTSREVCCDALCVRFRPVRHRLPTGLAARRRS